jgi:formate hydrogenlyase subunit 3/multisubunit Na+/H+ antiporter MnhD subunit
MAELDVAELIRDLVLNLVALFVLVYLIYYRQHRRREQAIGYVAFNVSLFTVAAALGSSNPLNVGATAI